MGARKSIPVGTVFSRLTVVGEAESHVRKNGQRDSRSKCLCECGNMCVVFNASLMANSTKSCGCWKIDKLKSRATHNNAKRGKQTAEYAVWKGIKSRTSNPKLKNFAYYGGRGISMCERWEKSFEAFLEDMGPRPSNNHSIDRIDNDGNYEPGNCRWATRAEQGQNTRMNKYLVIDGVKKTVEKWSQDTGIPRKTIYLRLSRGWSPEDAVMTPLQRRSYAT